MSLTLHGKTCTVVLFEQPGGKLRSLGLVEGTLRVSGGAVWLVSPEGGSPLRIPPHLVDDIEPVTDEHRGYIEEIASEYCLRAFYDGRLKQKSIDLDAVLAASSSPSTAK
jgi:hypothetical protein